MPDVTTIIDAYGCCGCGDSICCEGVDEYCLAITGLTDGVGGCDCTQTDGSYTLTRVGPEYCVWRTYDILVCGGLGSGYNPSAELQYYDFTDEWILWISSGDSDPIIAAYRLDGVDWDCEGENTMYLAGVTDPHAFPACNWPGTVTVTAGACP